MQLRQNGDVSSISIPGSLVSACSQSARGCHVPYASCIYNSTCTSHTSQLAGSQKDIGLCSCVQPCIGEHANHCLASSQHAQYCHWNLCFLAGMHIVAMAAGYIDAPPAELVVAPRKQVLVAVTSNWQVMCFDHNLRLLWETTILVCSTVSIGIQSKPCAVAHPDCKAPFLSHARIYDCHKHPLVGA